MSVPNTTTFTLQNVKNEIESNGGGSITSLSTAFSEAIDRGFDPAYVGSKNNLLNFRNYTHAYLTITPSSYSVSSSSGSVTYTISSNIAWTISDNAGWVTLNKSSGTGSTTVVATYQSNSSQLIRDCTITLTGGGFTRTVSLGQEGATGGTLSVSPTSMNFFANDSSNKQVTVTASLGLNWSVTTDRSWIIVSQTSGNGNDTFTVSVANNTSTTSDRSGTVFVNGGGNASTVQITQGGASCLVEGSVITMVNGEKKLIEDLIVEDYLLSEAIHTLEDTNNVEKLYKWEAKELVTQKVGSRIDNIVKVENQETFIINGGLIEATSSHNQLTLREGVWMFKPFRDLQIGDSLINKQKEIIPIVSITKGENKTVYKLTLSEPYHTFYGNDILTHNIK